MKIRAMQWAAVDTYLQWVRLPFDAAIRMLPDGGTGLGPAAAAAVDGADAGLRSVVAMILGDPVSVDDAETGPTHEAPDERRDSRGHERKASRSRRSAQQQEQARERRSRPRHKAQRARQPVATEERRTPAAATARTAGQSTVPSVRSETPSRAPDIGTADDQAPHAVAELMPLSPPSDDAIAARAYELYLQGTPGDAESHWEAAKRELAASR